MKTRRFVNPCSLIALVAVGAFCLPATPSFAQSAAGASSQESKAQPKPVYDESADAHEDIALALKKAKKNNSRVLIQWGANWCGWCKWLHHLCETDREIARKLQYEYEVVLVDIGRWDKHIDLTEKYGADLKSNGVPYLTILDADGNVIVNQETASLEVEEVDKEKQLGHDRKKVLGFLTKNQAEYRNADEILSEGLQVAAKENKKVFLHFGAPWCGWCHRLENWMMRPEIEKVLAEDYVDVKIDVDRTIGGKELLTKYRGSERGGIPWFVILDSKGEKLITSDGPEGNVGFPVKEDEVAHFIKMLKDTAGKMTADQLAMLKESLVSKP